MGLDMNLNKAKKQKNKTNKEIMCLADKYYDCSYVELEKIKKRYKNYLYTYTLFDFCGEKTYLFKQIAYWRKANAVHKWFVDNIQNGIDDCENYEVNKESLIELLEICKKILTNKKLAKILLPTQSGCFFGGCEYDSFYFKDIEYTKEIITKIINETDWENEFVYYQSSW